MKSRRNFLKTTFLSTIALALSPRWVSALTRSPHIGLQLYTVRDAMKQDLQGTLRMISRIGYTWLEAAGYSNGLFYSLPPSDFKKIVEDYGMQVVSSHATFSDEQVRQAIDAHAELGVKHLVYPIFPIEQDSMIPDFRRAAERLNRIGEASASSGIRFGYHNHDFEFVDFEDTRGYDLLLTSTDPDKVTFQADFYWMVFAGVDPVDYIKKYPDRFELWHVKDMEDGPDRSFAEVGTGVIDFREIFRWKDISGMKYFFVEQDSCKIDPMESIAISYRNLLSIID